MSETSPNPGQVNVPILATAASLAVLAIAGTISAYYFLATPNDSNQAVSPHDSTANAIAQEHDAENVESIISGLAERLEKNPDDPDGWALLARSYSASNQYQAAANAYERLFELTGPVPELEAEYGEVLVYVSGGIVTPQAEALFENVASNNPADPRAAYYLGLAKAQAGRSEEAIAMWTDLLNGAPSDATWAPAIRQQIVTLAAESGIEPGSLDMAESVSAPDAQASGHQPADGEQMEMIRTMVANLDTRLSEDPSDTDGWLKLARSYAVLGEREKAEDALVRATVNNPDPAFGEKVAALRAEFGLESSSSIDATTRNSALASPGDNTADMPNDHTPMIRQMVEGLSTRLESEPEDIAGWLQLARSYLALGEVEKAMDALHDALAVSPGNIDLLNLYADVALTATSEIPALRQASVEAVQGLLADNPNSVQGLFYAGLVAAQSGNADEARGYWEILMARLQPNSFTHAAVKRRYDELN